MIQVPGRVFLDTSVVNFILDHGDYIFDSVPIPPETTTRKQSDINSLYNIFFTGKRASWQLAISPNTYQEVIKTKEPNRRHYLENWFFDIWDYWLGIIHQENDLPTFIEAESIRINILKSGTLDILPDIEDRILIIDALVYRCDGFCTRDYRTIIRHRDHLKSIPIPIMTPTEWWKKIEPYSRLWT